MVSHSPSADHEQLGGAVTLTCSGPPTEVNAVRAGFIYTDMHASGGEPGRVDRLKDAIPMKRGGRPEEVAQAIVWLMSDAASFVTGSLLDVTGGR